MLQHLLTHFLLQVSPLLKVGIFVYAVLSESYAIIIVIMEIAFLCSDESSQLTNILSTAIILLLEMCIVKS